MPKVQPPELKGLMDKKLNSECTSSHRLCLQRIAVQLAGSTDTFHLEHVACGHHIQERCSRLCRPGALAAPVSSAHVALPHLLQCNCMRSAPGQAPASVVLENAPQQSCHDGSLTLDLPARLQSS